MNVLYRYLLHGHLYFMLLCLGLGTGLYLLADLFDRLDNFTNAGGGAALAFYYFLVKLPMIISQIMPAVFLVATVILLSLMNRSRELLALQVCGVSFTKLIRFVAVYALLWSVFQLAFSQLLGIPGEQTSSRIWKEEVKNREYDRSVIKNIWFKEGNYVVHLKSAKPAESQAEGVSIYLLSQNKQSLEKTYLAQSARVEDQKWTFHQVEIFSPQEFSQETLDTLSIDDITLDLRSFLAVESGANPSQMSLWQLNSVISQLKSSGSNVEALWTIWHMKLAYAASILVMGLIALAIATLGLGPYVNVPLAFIITFVYYSLFMFGISAAEKAAVSPITGAWSANILFALLSLGRLFVYLKPDLIAKGIDLLLRRHKTSDQIETTS